MTVSFCVAVQLHQSELMFPSPSPASEVAVNNSPVRTAGVPMSAKRLLNESLPGAPPNIVKSNSYRKDASAAAFDTVKNPELPPHAKAIE